MISIKWFEGAPASRWRGLIEVKDDSRQDAA